MAPRIEAKEVTMGKEEGRREKEKEKEKEQKQNLNNGWVGCEK